MPELGSLDVQVKVSNDFVILGICTFTAVKLTGEPEHTLIVSLTPLALARIESDVFTVKVIGTLGLQQPAGL